MPLMNCQDCGNDHSDAATACPKCGKPNLQKQNTSAPPSEFAKYTRNDDGPVVMSGGTSITAGTHERSLLVGGIIGGIMLGGCGIALALILAPIFMFIGKTNDTPTFVKGLVYGSIPWIVLWSPGFVAAMFK